MKKFFASVQKLTLLGAGLFVAGIVFTSCMKNLDKNNSSDTEAAGLMTYDLAPGYNSVGFSVSNSSLNAYPMSYNNFSGVYLPVYPGTHAVETFSFNTGIKVASDTMNLEAKKYYSVFFVGRDTNVENVIVRDNFDNLSASGQSYVRYINAINGGSGASVTVTASGSNVVNETAAFKAVSEFVPVNADSVTVKVSNGTTIDVSRTIALESNKIYTILLMGNENGTGNAAVQIRYVANGEVNNNSSRIANSGSSQSVK